jgi:hypothetical protein
VAEVPRHRAAKRVAEVPSRRAAKTAATRGRKAQRRHPRRSRTHPARDAPASVAVIGTHHKHRIKGAAKPSSHPRPPAEAPAPTPESTPPPVPEYVPPAPPEASPEPAPDSSATPGDGSEEFAPH